MLRNFFDKILSNKYMIDIFVLVFLFLIVFFIKNTYSKTSEFVVTDVEEKLFSKISYITEKNSSFTNEIIEFDYGDAKMCFNKLNYSQPNNDNFYEYTIPVKGSEISISYTIDQTKNTYETTSDYSNLPNSTIYIKTDMESFVFSIPTIYEKERLFETIQTDAKYEMPITINKNDDIFYITYHLPKDDNYISEFYYLKSDKSLFDFDDVYTTILTANEISGRFRVLEDGFYQKSHKDYYPTGEGNYFRICSNYVAKSYIANNNLKDDRIKLFDYLGYSFAYVTDKQINEYGYFPTKSRSNWLFSDFAIDSDFFDTRFNADNAEMNLALYKKYPEDFVKETLDLYSEFLIQYIDNHSYKTDNGVLVEDYYNPNGGIKTHSSLNHSLANLNVLLSLYEIYDDERFLDRALLMLRGIEDTKEQWILDDGNLAYALHYEGTYSKLVDYPYLTYNDLFICKKRLDKLEINTEVIEQLMESKLTYMTNNNITGYYVKYYE